MLAVIGVGGISAPMTVNGAVDGAVFLAYVRELLAPTLCAGDIEVMDNLGAHNLGAHQVAGVREAIEAKGARVQYLPPYSPNFNPIEKCWSKIKTVRRRRGHAKHWKRHSKKRCFKSHKRTRARGSLIVVILYTDDETALIQGYRGKHLASTFPVSAETFAFVDLFEVFLISGFLIYSQTDFAKAFVFRQSR